MAAFSAALAVADEIGEGPQSTQLGPHPARAANDGSGAFSAFAQDPAEIAARYGAEVSVPISKTLLVCGECDSRRVDMVVTGIERRG